MVYCLSWATQEAGYLQATHRTMDNLEVIKEVIYTMATTVQKTVAPLQVKALGNWQDLAAEKYGLPRRREKNVHCLAYYA